MEEKTFQLVRHTDNVPFDVRAPWPSGPHGAPRIPYVDPCNGSRQIKVSPFTVYKGPSMKTQSMPIMFISIKSGKEMELYPLRGFSQDG